MAIPQLDAGQDETEAVDGDAGGGVAAAGVTAAGVAGDIDDIDNPPQALKAAISIVQPAADNHRC